MFDTFNIPNVPLESALYAEIIEQKEAAFNFSVAQIKNYVETVAAKFNLTAEELTHKGAQGRPAKNLRGNNLTLIRMIIVQKLDEAGDYRDEDLSQAFDINRASVSYLRKTGRLYREVEDRHYLKYEDKINGASLKAVSFARSAVA